jgi:hypothetical protein
MAQKTAPKRIAWPVNRERSTTATLKKPVTNDPAAAIYCQHRPR